MGNHEQAAKYVEEGRKRRSLLLQSDAVTPNEKPEHYERYVGFSHR